MLCDRYQGFWQFGLCCRFSRLVGRVVNAGAAAVVLLLPLPLPLPLSLSLLPALLPYAPQFAIRRCLLRCLLRLRLFLAETVWYFSCCFFFANCRCGDQHSRVAAAAAACAVLRSRARLVYFVFFFASSTLTSPSTAAPTPTQLLPLPLPLRDTLNLFSREPNISYNFVVMLRGRYASDTDAACADSKHAHLH